MAAHRLTTVTPRHRLVLAMLAAASMGADGFWSCGQPRPPPSPAPSAMITPDPDALPECPQDPPRDCWALCLDVHLPGFSDQCFVPPVGMLTAAFEAVVNDQLAKAEAQGVEVCPEGQLFAGNVTPCAVGITPQVDQSTPCKPVPPGCGL